MSIVSLEICVPSVYYKHLISKSCWTSSVWIIKSHFRNDFFWMIEITIAWLFFQQAPECSIKHSTFYSPSSQNNLRLQPREMSLDCCLLPRTILLLMCWISKRGSLAVSFTVHWDGEIFFTAQDSVVSVGWRTSAFEQEVRSNVSTTYRSTSFEVKKYQVVLQSQGTHISFFSFIFSVFFFKWT